MRRDLVMVGKPVRVGWGGHVPWRSIVVLHVLVGESSLEAVAVAAAEVVTSSPWHGMVPPRSPATARVMIALDVG